MNKNKSKGNYDFSIALGKLHFSGVVFKRKLLGNDIMFILDVEDTALLVSQPPVHLDDAIEMVGK